MLKKIFSFVLFALCSVVIVQADESSLDSLVKKGIMIHKQGNYHAAIKLYQDALKEYPGESILHYEMAVSYMAIGVYEKALEHVNRVKDPNGQFENEAILLKSSVLDALYKYDEAEKLLKDGLIKNSDNCLFHYNLAHVYYKQSKDNKAILSLIEALKINPTHSGSHFLMGRIFSKHVRKSESLMAYYFFLLAEPDSPKSKITLKLIDNLIALGVSKTEGDSSKAQIYVAPDTTNIFAKADILMSLTATNYEVSHFKSETNEEILVAKMVAFFSLLESISNENQNKNNFMIDFYTSFFIDMHKAHHTETFCRYIRQSVAKTSIDWLQAHPEEVKEFENWLNSYYTDKR